MWFRDVKIVTVYSENFRIATKKPSLMFIRLVHACFVLCCAFHRRRLPRFAGLFEMLAVDAHSYDMRMLP
jgi:hypothetical protein